MIKSVIDTHVWVAALSSHSPFHWIVDALLDKKFELFVSHDILLEYEENLKERYNTAVVDNFLRALRELQNSHSVEVYFQWHLLDETDVDDNKFVDAAFAANVHYLVSDDRHYNPLSKIPFPKINRIKLAEFKKILKLE